MSVVSARSVVSALDALGHEYVTVGITSRGRWIHCDPRGGDVVPDDGRDYTLLPDPQAPKDVDVAFSVLHGPYGEDGSLQGLFELADLAYVGAGVEGSAIGINKVTHKRLFVEAGLPVVDFVAFARDEWTSSGPSLQNAVEKLGYPFFCKPVRLGSSVGISKVHDPAGLGPAIATALDYDRKAIVERAVPDAREIECAVIGNDAPEASVPGEIAPSREFYDYEAKYLDNRSRVTIPALLDAAVEAEVRRLAIAAFRAIDGAGLARVDFLLSRSTGELVVNEINTLPGFTTISMYAKLWAAMHRDLGAVVDRLITLALERHAERQHARVTAF